MTGRHPRQDHFAVPSPRALIADQSLQVRVPWLRNWPVGVEAVSKFQLDTGTEADISCRYPERASVSSDRSRQGLFDSVAIRRETVQDHAGKGSRTGRLWVYIGDYDNPFVVYDYNSDWVALSRYLESPYLSIDNHPTENAIRPIALCRKNWLHLGSDRGGRTAATLLSVVQSC